MLVRSTSTVRSAVASLQSCSGINNNINGGSGTTSGVGMIGGIEDCMGRHHDIVVDRLQINDTLNRFLAPGEQDFENMAL